MWSLWIYCKQFLCFLSDPDKKSITASYIPAGAWQVAERVTNYRRLSEAQYIKITHFSEVFNGFWCSIRSPLDPVTLTIISRMQCWLFSIRGQIKMSHYFDIKKKSIFISIVLVKFLTIVCWIYKIPYYSGLSRPSDKGGSGHPDPEMGGGARSFFQPLGPHFGACAKKLFESAHTKPRRSIIAICFGIHLSFTMSSMLCVHRLRVLHNKSWFWDRSFESMLLSNNIRPILFEFCDL